MGGEGARAPPLAPPDPPLVKGASHSRRRRAVGSSCFVQPPACTAMSYIVSREGCPHHTHKPPTHSLAQSPQRGAPALAVRWVSSKEGLSRGRRSPASNTAEPAPAARSASDTWLRCLHCGQPGSARSAAVAARPLARLRRRELARAQAARCRRGSRPSRCGQRQCAHTPGMSLAVAAAMGMRPATTRGGRLPARSSWRSAAASWPLVGPLVAAGLRGGGPPDLFWGGGGMDPRSLVPPPPSPHPPL